MLEYNVSLQGKIVLVTGVAGFIGANLCERLLREWKDIVIVGIDSMTDYYDVKLKYNRLEQLSAYGKRFVFIMESIANKKVIDKLFSE